MVSLINDNDPEVNSLTTSESVTVTDGEGTDTLHYGSDQDRANAGDRGVALGFNARTPADEATAVGVDSGTTNTGIRSVSIGFFAGRDNSADKTVAVGEQAARFNTGESTVAIGSGAAINNTGPRLSAVGVNAGTDNTGLNVVALGPAAAGQNTGDRCLYIGEQSGRGDGLANQSLMGDDNIGIGSQALRNSTASGVIALGANAGSSASTDDQFIVTDRNGSRRMVMDLTNGNLKIDGTLTENVTL
jgi:hypothetical protein